MHKRMLIIALLIAFIFTLIYHLMVAVFMETRQLKDCQRSLDNPSRGYYKQLSTTEIHRLENLEDGIRLVLVAFDITEFRNGPISQEKLDELRRFLSQGQSLGIKFIFRAAYGFTSDTIDNDITDLSLLGQHIQQIAPILNQYKAVIYCVQAGFIGPWGEWHSSLLLKEMEDAEQTLVRNQVVDWLLSNLDESIAIALRRPSFVLDAVAAGLPIERLCIHNDGLFASESDLGTYNLLRADALTQWAEKIQLPINGGEMPAVSQWTDPNSVNQEMFQMKLSYLNAFYNTEVLEQWASSSLSGENALDYISNHLGYRLYLSEIKVPMSFAPYTQYTLMPVSFTLSNSGYAAVPNTFIAELIVVSNGKEIVVKPLPPLSKITSEHNLTYNAFIGVNADMIANGFQIGLRIFDSQLKDVSEYAYHIQLANGELAYADGVNWIISF